MFYDHDRGKTHSSGKLLFSARVIPYRGSWLDFEFDPKDAIFTRIDRRRKLPVTILLRALGMDNEEILSTFFETTEATLKKDGAKLQLIPERLRGETAFFDIRSKTGKVLVPKGKRITALHVRTIEEAGVKSLEVPDEYLIGKILARDVIDKESGEVLAAANAEITEELLEALRDAGVKKLELLYVNDLDQGPYISNTLNIDPTRTELEALAERYIERVMQVLKTQASRKRHVNVLQHLQGFLKNEIDSEDKQELLGLLEDYRQGLVPLILPQT